MSNTEYELIANNSELVSEVCSDIERETAGFLLKENDIEACKNVWAENDCNEGYERGRTFMRTLKKHVSNTSGFFQQISDALQMADQAVVVRTNQGDIKVNELGVPQSLPGTENKGGK